MLRLPVSVSLGFFLFATAAGFAQDGSETTAVDAVVIGVAPNDLLNIRADASPLGRTMGRLPNGSLVRQYECETVDSYKWCRIEAVEGDDLIGWTPARYLQPLETIGMEPAVAETAAAPTDTPAESPASEERASVPGIPVPTPAPRFEAETEAEISGKGSRLPAEETTALLPLGLEARFAAGSSVPLEDVRAVGTPQDGDAIPCARYVGQPMTRCAARVVQRSPGEADVTVVWPDGGTRLIEFRDGVPARSNSRGELRYTKEGSLNMIRIGISERFEILDALALED